MRPSLAAFAPYHSEPQGSPIHFIHLLASNCLRLKCRFEMSYVILKFKTLRVRNSL